VPALIHARQRNLKTGSLPVGKILQRHVDFRDVHASCVRKRTHAE
jgi:hypothetical protein